MGVEVWRPVAPCGAVLQPKTESCAPYTIPCSVLGWMASWLAGWLDGCWLAGWLDGLLAG